jgi:predicted RNase H-like nuclease (RuvC/YqgF family)
MKGSKNPQDRPPWNESCRVARARIRSVMKQRSGTVSSGRPRERQTVEVKLADPEVYKKGENIADLVKSHGDLKKRMEALTAEWEALSLQLEEIDRQREAELENPASE